MSGVSPEPVTDLLRRWRQGDSTALETLLPLVYNEPSPDCERQLRRERPNHTLQPTRWPRGLLEARGSAQHRMAEPRTVLTGRRAIDPPDSGRPSSEISERPSVAPVRSR